MFRKIPSTMATQHPDNAGCVWWLGKPFIDSKDEIKEALVSLGELSCEEFMWDWEGKYVDEAVIERLFEEDFPFFQKRPLGKKVFITYRIPNIWVEKGSYRVLRAFANVLTASDIARDLKLHYPPVFEVILPMTTKAEQLVYLQTKFAELSNLLRKDVQTKIGSGSPETIEIIPLIEDIPYLLGVDNLLEEYVSLYKQKFSRIKKIEHIRPFIARSDPALNYGLVAAVLSAKVAISKIYKICEKLDIKVYPIIGCGTVPFRGHLSPRNITNFLREYQGIKTVTIQSSFRYDYPLEEVKEAIKTLSVELANQNNIPFISRSDLTGIEKLVKIFKDSYRREIVKIAGLINEISGFVPRRRERRLHIGLFGYSREFTRGIHLPRAITFTASLYSLGIPPEIIGVGRALKVAQKEGLEEILEKYYLNLKWDLKEACGFVNRENIKRLKRKYPSLEYIEQDLGLIERILKIPTEPVANKQLIHKNLTSNILLFLEEDKDVTQLIEEAGILRNFLG